MGILSSIAFAPERVNEQEVQRAPGFILQGGPGTRIIIHKRPERRKALCPRVRAIQGAGLFVDFVASMA
jgi:hypothetical protein